MANSTIKKSPRGEQTYTINDWHTNFENSNWYPIKITKRNGVCTLDGVGQVKLSSSGYNYGDVLFTISDVSMLPPQNYYGIAIIGGGGANIATLIITYSGEVKILMNVTDKTATQIGQNVMVSFQCSWRAREY